jgi:mono/diheme cytochrome c family protein
VNFAKVAITIAAALLAVSCTGSNQTVNTGQAAPSPGPTSAAVKSSPTPDEYAAAREIYSQKCAACHGEKAEGGVVQLDKSKPKLKVPSLTTGHATTHPEEQLAKQISNGGQGMPPFKDKLTPEQITGLVRYIRNELQRGAAPAAATPGGAKK